MCGNMPTPSISRRPSEQNTSTRSWAMSIGTRCRSALAKCMGGGSRPAPMPGSSHGALGTATMGWRHVQGRRDSVATVTLRQLLEAGTHFGHQTRRWNPKMKRYIFTERNGNYIIDLRQSLDYIEKAYDFIKNTDAEGGSILFAGTKKTAQEAIAEQAAPGGM